MTATFEPQQQEDRPLPPLLDEFRTALRDEIEAARRASSASAVDLVSGRRVGSAGNGFQYVFLVDTALNLPDDSPGDLYVPSLKQRVETTVVSIEGLAVTLSVPIDLGDFVPRARLQSDLTHLLRTLIQRIEELAEAENPAGGRLLGREGSQEPSGEPAELTVDGLNAEQQEAVRSGVGRDTTFVWGPPGTGKTRTIGALGAVLHGEGRSVLLVSHTNAAVDQAMLRLAVQVDPAELEQGKLIRLGQTKERMLEERPELLAETHIQRRSAELIDERAQLQTEQAKRSARLADVERLLELAAWLPAAPAEIQARRAQLDELATLERAEAETSARADAVQEQIEAIREIGEAAAEAIALAGRAAALAPKLEDARRRLKQAGAELVELEPRRAEAEQIAQDARVHVPRVLEARRRLEELRAELPRREPLVVAADEELAELERSLAEANDLLARTQEANAVGRRLRRLPRSEDQRAVIESLRVRTARLSEARDATVAGVEALNKEFREAEETIVRYGDLPNPGAAAQVALAFRQKEERLQALVRELTGDIARFDQELTGIGDPLAEFRRTYGREAAEVAKQLARLREELEPMTRKLGVLRSQVKQLRSSVSEALAVRLSILQRLDVAGALSESLGEQLELIEEGRRLAAEQLAAVSVERLRAERSELQRRLREISARLDEIEEALQAVEEVVVAEASIVTTTLTRAYKRDSVQKRRFDTVILDEASMAPIPALWVVAARAQTNVVLVGDFKQLPPIHHSAHPLADKWLGRDIFEVAGMREDYESGEPPPHFIALWEQHRMHPQISAIANRFVYDGKLRDAPGVTDDSLLDGWFHPDGAPDVPVLLVDTSGLNAWVTSVSHGGRTSRLNFLSATVCVDLAEMLLRPDRPAFEVGARPRILICAPYRPQMKLLTLILREQQLAGEVNAGTAHTFQGNEAPVMIFDLVNDEPHWRVGMFNANYDQNTKPLLNVALTRAKRRLIIVGDFTWIERQAGKESFLRRLVHQLKESVPVVDARELLPKGLAARAAKAHASSHISRDEPVPPQLVVTETFFFDYLACDLADARQRVVIYSPFAAYERVGRLEPHLRAAVDRGVEVWVVTKPLEERGRDRAVYEQIESGLRGWGIQIAHKRGMHEKLVFVDDHVLWQGSLNPLSQSTTQEIMERRASKEIVEDYKTVLRLDELIGAYAAGETTCPYCGSEVVAAEGRDDVYYWRCVVDDCFSRSIGDPMPVDGKVVCRTRECGGELEFRWPNETPFWRCTKNHHHRQPFAKSHLRLPAMCAMIPKTELRKLRRRFGVEETPANASVQLRLESSDPVGFGRWIVASRAVAELPAHKSRPSTRAQRESNLPSRLCLYA